MPSLAKVKFDVMMERAALLSVHAGALRRKRDSEAKSVFLHASLAAQVAAWEVYLKAVVLEYYSTMANAGDPSFNAVHTMLQSQMRGAAKKLNTPNSEKCRDFLMMFAAFDPWPSWAGVKFGTAVFSNSLMSRTRIDEIFSLRHSFAHGFSMPVHSWNSNPHGLAHLDCSIVKNTARFFSQITANTDSAFARHIALQHSTIQPW